MSEMTDHLTESIEDLLAKDTTGVARQLYDAFERFGYKVAPASAYYHNCFKGGLMMHSLNVTHAALAFNKALKLTVPEGDIVIAGLFHDVNKLGIISWNHGKQDWEHIPRYVPDPKFDSSKPVSKRNAPYKFNTTVKMFEGGISSVYCAYFAKLPFDVQVAIYTHDDSFVPGNDGGFMHNKGHLGVLITLGDRAAGDLLENPLQGLQLTSN